jgi:hypothetical protein
MIWGLTKQCNIRATFERIVKASKRMKALYDRLAKSAGFHEAGHLELFRLTWTSESHLSCSHPAKALTR